MEPVLTLLSRLAWIVVYVAAIRIGFRQKTYAMPIAALGLNLAWEWVYSIQGIQGGLDLQDYINIAWALADVAVLYTFFRFGRSELPGFVTKPLFIAWGVGILGASLLIQLLFVAEFGLAHNASATYSAFLQNLLMSGLFIAMFMARRGARGQSLTIAVAKWIGTLAPTITFGVLHGSPFVLGVGLLCSVFDLAYIGLLLWARTRPAVLLPAERPSGARPLIVPDAS